MKIYSANEIRNIVVLGHSGCGKTTLVEGALFHSGATKRFGKVSEGNTISDYDPEEIRRKSSTTTSVIPVEWQDTKINFLDTPGYFDFLGEVKTALSVADAALLLVSAKSGLQVGAEKAWEYSEKENLPKIIFVNHMDDENADFDNALNQLREKFGKSVAPLQIPFFDDNGKYIGFINLIKRDARMRVGDKLERCDIPENMKETVEELREMIIEVVAETDDELLDKFFNDEELTYDEIYKGLEVGIMGHKITPVMCGAATLSFGVKMLLNTIVKFIPPSNISRPMFGCTDLKINKITNRYNDPNDHFSAYVFKTISDPYIGRLSIFKVTSGTFKKDTTIYNPEKDTLEKVSHLYIIRGKEQIEVSELQSGDIGALAKLTNTKTGHTLCSKEFPILINKTSQPNPVHAMAIVPKDKSDEDKISQALTKIREEDPIIKVEQNIETKETLIYGLGEVHLDVVEKKLLNKYKINVSLTKPKIAYRETIKGKVKVQGKYKKQSGGHGQFGDVWIQFEPSLDMEVPYVFEEKVFGGSVPKQYFPAVEKGLTECVNEGTLAGYPVIGIKATLLDGSYHPVDSSEMAFKMATIAAFKDGVSKADPVILEPIVLIQIATPDKYMGDIMGDMNKRRGKIISMNPVGEEKIIEAEVPLAEIFKYGTDLRSITKSRGRYTYSFSKYEEVPFDVQKKIVENKA